MSDEFAAARYTLAALEAANTDVNWEKVEPHIRANRTRTQAADALTYMRSLRTLQNASNDMISRWGKEFDILLTPTTSSLPPRAGEILASIHEVARSGGDAFETASRWNNAGMACTFPFSATGQPAISLPIHWTADGMPVGVQLVAGPWEEAMLFRVASQLEIAIPWVDRRPPIN